tara:strand:+ start:303 stop:818 length:516 start_codon:yes stop_codon:yes gene_type:complete
MELTVIQIHGKFRRSKAIGTWLQKTFTVSPHPSETVREAWYREHGPQWDVYIMRSSDPTIPIDSVLSWKEPNDYALCVHCDESHHVDDDHQCKDTTTTNNTGDTMPNQTRKWIMENNQENRLRLAEAIYGTLSLGDLHEQFIDRMMARYGNEKFAFEDDLEMINFEDEGGE